MRYTEIVFDWLVVLQIGFDLIWLTCAALLSLFTLRLDGITIITVLSCSTQLSTIQSKNYSGKKYIKMYEQFVNQLKEYSQAIRILPKGYLPISLLPTSKLAKILHEVKQVLLKINKNFGLVIKGMYNYYNM